MLEIVFTKGKIGDGAVKIIGISANQKVDSASLSASENQQLQQFAQSSNFSGKVGEFFRKKIAKHEIIVVGLGTKPSSLTLQHIGYNLIQELYHDEVAAFYTQDLGKDGITSDKMAINLAFGMQLGAYSFDKYQTSKPEKSYLALEQVNFIVSDSEKTSRNYRFFAALTNSVRYCKDLINEPFNYLTPQTFASDIQRLQYLGLDIDIWDQKQLIEQNFGLFKPLLSDVDDAEYSPAVAVIKWHGNPKSSDWNLALIGSAVNGQNVIGTSVAVATLKALALQCCPQNIMAVVSLCSDKSLTDLIKPEEIYSSYSGKNVEIKNCQAIERLLLADMAVYVEQEFKPSVIMTIGTDSLGSEENYDSGILYTNDNMLGQIINHCASKNGENLQYKAVPSQGVEALSSLKADLTNGNKWHCSDVETSFIEQFINPKTFWVHLDIGQVAYDNNRMATAFGIKTLNYFINKGI